MKTLIIVLTISAFLESTILPLDLVLMILICRAFLKGDKANLYLAFGFGLLTSHLNLTPLGLQSIIFLAMSVIISSLSNSRLSQNSIFIIPLCFVAIGVNQIAISAFSNESLELLPKIFGAFLSFPIFILIRFWEERFIPRKELKLRI